jgi:hypothetical protein
MNIWSEIILPIVPFLGMLLFLILLLALLKSGYTEVVTFLLFTMFAVTVCLVMITQSNEVNTKFGNFSQYVFSDMTDDTNGAEVLGLDYKTSKLTLKLASGNIEEYTLTHYPVRITNPESVDEKLSSALYAYLWNSHIASPATILDWDENTKQMIYRLGNSTSNQVVKMGVESFYKQDVQQVRGSSNGTMDTLRDIVIGYTFYKAVTGGFK